MKTVTPRTLFINRNFLLLWLGQALSSFGEFLAIIVLVGGALMLYSVRRPASAVEMARANQ